VNFDVEQFQQSFGTCKIVVSLSLIFRSSLLYTEVWKIRCGLPAHQKVSLRILIIYQWSVVMTCCHYVIF